MKNLSIILVCIFLLGSGLGLFASGQDEGAGSDEPVEIQFWYAFSDAPRSGWIQDRIAEWNES